MRVENFVRFRDVFPTCVRGVAILVLSMSFRVPVFSIAFPPPTTTTQTLLFVVVDTSNVVFASLS